MGSRCVSQRFLKCDLLTLVELHEFGISFFFFEKVNFACMPLQILSKLHIHGDFEKRTCSKPRCAFVSV